MMPPYSCAVPGMKPGTSTKVMMGMLKASQKRTKRAGLDRALDVEAAGQHHRLVGDDADRLAFHARKADHDVLRVVGLHLEEVDVVDHLEDQFLDVVGLVRIVRHQGVERIVEAVGRVIGRPVGGFPCC
jgi:hypothetical protein